jgi:hypothetical protein
MKRRLLFAGLFMGILLFACAGWTVRGTRWAFAAPARAFA